MDYNFSFEKNLDSILFYIHEQKEGANILDLINNFATSSIYIMIEQLSVDGFITVGEDCQSICLTNSGKSFIENSGGYVQSYTI